MTTKTKSKAVVLFDPGSIELAITGAIKKNTIPAVREAWTTWLDSFDAKKLETDQDFDDAAKYVAEFKRVEDRLDDIETTALKGDVFKAISEIRTMRETTRQKRLAFSKAVDARRAEVKGTAIHNALEQLQGELGKLPHRLEYRNATEYPQTRLLAAIKGKSAILKMQEALEDECDNILLEAKNYSKRFDVLRGQVEQLYASACETVTDSELTMLVTTHYEDAPERAKMILAQKKLSRDQEALDKQKPAPVSNIETKEPSSRAEVDVTVTRRTLRFGATFVTAAPEQVIALIHSIGGTDVKYVNFK